MKMAPGRAVIGLAALLTVIGASTSAASAQSLSYAGLTGRVTDEAGQPLRDARVVVTAMAGGGAHVQMTDAAGHFAYRLLAPGRYAMRVEQIGYRPRVLLNIEAPAGQQLALDVALTAAKPPVMQVDTTFEGSGASRTADWLSRRELEHVPSWQGSALAGLQLVPDVSGDALGGRAPGSADVTVDGFPIPAGMAAALLPPDALEGMHVLRAPVDVEWPGGGGGVIALYTRSGSGPLRGELSGSGAGALGSPFFKVPGGLSPSTQGDAVLLGSTAGDTARFMGAFHYSRLALPEGRGGAVGAVENAAPGLFRSTLGTTTLETRRVAGFGRMDWMVTGNNELSVRGGFASLPRWESLPVAGVPLLGAPELWKSRDATVDALLASTLGDNVSSEVRFGFSDQRREPGTIAGMPRLPETIIASLGANVGSPLEPVQADARDILVSANVYGDVGAHGLKFGAGVESRSESWAGPAGTSRFLFADPGALENGAGSALVLEGPPPAADFRVSDVFMYLQDTWNAAPDMRLTGGLRLDYTQVGGASFTTDPQWTQLSGVAANSPASASLLGPRFGFVWHPSGGSTTLTASAGLYSERPSMPDLTEAVALDGGTIAHRGVGGILGGWPAAPGAGDVPATGPVLTLLGPDFTPPRSERASILLTHATGSLFTLGLRGDFRHTTLLPQRSDLNLPTAPATVDEHGRPVYGPLVQQGALVVARPGANRRFPGFDMVSGLSATGESNYSAVTAFISHSGRWLETRIGYTYSRTTDDLVGAASGSPLAELSPFPNASSGAPANWDQGTSDFDVPQRLVVSAFIHTPLSRGVTAEVGGVYRYASGRPFTPGFRPGVDVNGDGSGLNDPAFVDTNVQGMNALLSTWSCLRQSEGAFAARNSCRGPARHTVDLRARLGFHTYGIDGALVLDLFNAVQMNNTGWIDSALYLVDPSGAIHTNSDGTLALPLVANPHFGKTLIWNGPARMLRLGLQLGF